MNWILSIVAVFFLLTTLALPEQPVRGEVRDASGKLLYKIYTRGNVTETRQPSGKLITKSRTTNGKTEVRSPTGKFLYKAK